MKNDPLQPHERGKASDSRGMNNPREMPNLFAQFRRAPALPPQGTLVPNETVASLKALLGTIAETFRGHGMVDLAAEADEVAALL
jgi:hypothetical protein